MTLNSKVLSLVLLAGLTMGGTYAKKQKTDWNNDSHSVKWSEEKCNAGTPAKACPDNICPTNPPKDCCETCCTKLCDKDCSQAWDCCADCTQPRCFRAYLSADNVVRTSSSGSTQSVITRTVTNAERNACGQVDICFDKYLTKVCYRVTLCNIDCDTTNIPDQGQIGFYCLQPDEAPTANTNRPNSYDNEAAIIVNISAATDGKVCKFGSITQADLTSNNLASGRSPNVSCVNFIPLMYQACLNFSFAAIYSQKPSVANCSTGGIQVNNGLSSGGALRGTFIPCLPKCGN